MYLKLLSSLVFVTLLYTSFAENEKLRFVSNESRLIYDLFTKSMYDTNVRPISDPSKAVVVEFMISLITIEDLDLKNEVLVLNVWQTLRWKDEFMKWNPEEYGGIKKIQVSSDRLWLPDIKLANEVQDFGMVPNMDRPKCIASYDGTILNVPSRQLRSSCTINVRYFPFDSQICTLKFMPWSHTGFQLDLSLFDDNTNGADLNEYSTSTVYRIFKFFAEKHEVVYGSEEGLERYVDISISIGLARKPLHYIYSLILPCAIISILVLLVFRLSADSGEKIALGVTLLLVFQVMLWGLSEKLPETDHMPLFALYLSLIMIMTGLSVILSVAVLNLHGKGHENQVPIWMRKLILEKLATLLCMSHVNLKDKYVDQNEIEISEIVITVGDATQNETPMEKLLKLLLLNQELENKKTDTADEWRAMAMVVDRLFFWCFSIITIVISIYMLLVIPLTNRTPTDENLKDFQYLL